ncbi:hypothetical protein HDV06_002835 [Boothiomyces sp. JEL0866]|nr:hypothetical protein HDV06_002835 [Boothiomyces sp. JEL0866]
MIIYLAVKEYILAETQFTNKWINRNYKIIQQVEKDLAIDIITHPQSCIEVGSDVTGYWEAGNYIYWVIDGKYSRQNVAYNQCNCYTKETKELLLDINQFVKNSEYSGVGIFEVLDDNILAFSLDLNGGELFDLYIYNYTSHTTLYGPISNTYYSARWYSGDYLYYNTVDLTWGVPLDIFRIHLRNLQIEKVYHETDPALTVELVKSNDDQYLFIKAAGQVTSEYHIVNQDSLMISLKPVFPRIPGIYYDLEHNNGLFYCRSNINNANFSIFSFPADNFANQITIYSDDKIFIEKLEMLQTYIILWVRENTLRTITTINLVDLAQKTINLGPGPYSINPGMYTDIDSRVYRNFNQSCIFFSNSSFVQPERLYYLNLRNNVPQLIIDAYTSYDVDLFVEEQLIVPNLSIPLSIVYKKGSSYLEQTSHLPRPLFINAYGAYGGFQDPVFSTEIFPLVQRGYVWAVCHPKGDGDVGRNWYLNGKYEKKKNTFLDVQRCIDYLVSLNKVNPNCISLKGRSAGGLVAGNAIISNFFTTKFETVIANVPFIDPIYDMLDETVPWTSYEWTEWGSPHNSSILQAMLEYSPYHNIRTNSFPAVYVSCGLADSRVPYYEPLKFVAKIRSFKNDNHSPTIIKIEKEGHFMNQRGKIEYLAFVISNSNCLT